MYQPTNNSNPFFDQAYKKSLEFNDDIIKIIENNVFIKGRYVTCKPGSYYEDTKLNGDLILYDYLDKKYYVSARLLRSMKYKGYFTVRYSRDNKVDGVEYQKMVSGKGDFMFFGIQNKDNKIVHWDIINLESLREYIRNPAYSYNYKIRSNEFDPGKTVEFIKYTISSFKNGPKLILASSSDRHMKY
jgi:hypothetical protein